MLFRKTQQTNSERKQAMIASDKRFERAIGKILLNEGGYSNDPQDKGGETKYGISKRSYPTIDIKSLTLEEAKEIYYRDFWDKYKYCSIRNEALAEKVFDLAVNIGPYWSHCLLQRALKSAGRNQIVEDGILGAATMLAVNHEDANILLAALRSEAAGYYRAIVILRKEQSKFLRGWLNRAYA